MASGDLPIRRIVKATCEDLAPKLRIPPTDAHGEDAIAALGKTAPGEGGERLDEYRRSPFTIGFQQRTAGQATNLSKALPQTRTVLMGRSTRIAIKTKRRILFINVPDIVAVEAKGKYVLLLRTASSHLLRECISTMEAKLNLHGFVRIHRSVLVNAAMVEEMHPMSTGEYLLRVRGGKEFTVTRTYKKNLQLLAQLWIGLEGFAVD